MLNQWVKAALDASGMSGAELARRMTGRVGRSIDRSTVNKMQNGKRRISADELIAISEITDFPPPDAKETAARAVPLVSWVSAGALQSADGITDLSDCPLIEASGLPKGDWFALMVEGDSMDRISPPGSIIFVNRRDRTLVPNGLYVIADEEGAATYKRYRGSPDRFEPVSVNTAHEAIFPEGRVRVIGRVRRTILEM